MAAEKRDANTEFTEGRAQRSPRRRNDGGLEGEGGGALDGELVSIGEYFFNLAEAGGAFAEFIPLCTLHGKKNFVNVAEGVLAAAEGGFEFLRDGELRQDVVHGFIEQGIGDGEKTHEKQAGTLILEAGGPGNFLAEIGACESSADQLGGFAAA